MSDLQIEVDTYINQFKEGYFPPMELLARLTEELGELSREVQHKYGTKKKKHTEVEKKLQMKWEISFSYCYAWQMRKV